MIIKVGRKGEKEWQTQDLEQTKKRLKKDRNRRVRKTVTRETFKDSIDRRQRRKKKKKAGLDR